MTGENEPTTAKARRVQECPTCHRPLGTTERHRRFCRVCGAEQPKAPVDPRERHTAAEGERRLKHGDSG